MGKLQRGIYCVPKLIIQEAAERLLLLLCMIRAALMHYFDVQKMEKGLKCMLISCKILKYNL